MSCNSVATVVIRLDADTFTTIHGHATAPEALRAWLQQQVGSGVTVTLERSSGALVYWVGYKRLALTQTGLQLDGDLLNPNKLVLTDRLAQMVQAITRVKLVDAVKARTYVRSSERVKNDDGTTSLVMTVTV